MGILPRTSKPMFRGIPQETLDAVTVTSRTPNPESRKISLRSVRRLGTSLEIKQWAANRTASRRLLSAVRHPSCLFAWLTPISYTRHREFEFVFSNIHHAWPNAILDIS